MTSRHLSLEQLYARGMAQLRAAQWKAAVETLSELRTISSAYPEVDTLIADALLKIRDRSLARARWYGTAQTAALLRPRFLTAVLVLFALGGALLIAMRPFGAAPTPATPQPTSAASLPTPAPTNVPPATAAPSPTAEPSPTALPTAAPAADLGRARSRCEWPMGKRWCERLAILRSFLMHPAA